MANCVLDVMTGLDATAKCGSLVYFYSFGNVSSPSPQLAPSPQLHFAANLIF